MNKTYIAMWSGPRNLSTALMRSFENRSDTTVIDEPFYAYFLKQTNLNHPGRDEIISTLDSNWNSIVKKITGPIPRNRSIWYQKHMAQHNLEGCDINWIKSFHNCILIRDPKYVIPSYSKEHSLSDEKLLGYSQQLDLVRILEDSEGVTPPIFDATDILINPEQALKKICISVGISFSYKMLKWPRGKRKSDGIWAKYWYGNVENSSGFKPFQKKNIIIDKEHISLYDNCLVGYNSMYEKRITF
tara:strand:+ start:314 stop:1045 length:732 start_codon:yes stop_codon:yes gene_type:complete